MRIITPGVADKKLVKIMTKSAYPALMESGVEIYEYTPGFIHGKALVSDDKYAVVGTINLDYRSLVHHFEDAVWMYGTPTVMRVKEDFIQTLGLSHKLTEDEARLGAVEKMLKSINQLIAPLL